MNRPKKLVTLVIPSGLFRFLRQVFGVAAEEIPEDLLLLEEHDSRWYLTLRLHGVQHDLWYYTTSNLPYWATAR